MCGGSCNNDVIANFPQNVTVKKVKNLATFDEDIGKSRRAAFLPMLYR